MDQIPGRMALLLTLMLCLITIFNSATDNYPRNAQAITTWTMSCMGFITLAISEYAVLLGYKKFSNSAKVEADKSKNQREIARLSVVVDKWMLVVFPPTFIVFSGLFWSL